MADKKLTVERSLEDFRRAYRAKRKLIERQKDDFLFRLGKQWPEDKWQSLKDRGVEPVTDNRIQSLVFLLTGLERQNRTDFKALPTGEEDTIKAEIATGLFKHAIEQSDYGYKASESFEDGTTCGESHLELYLDNTFNLLNAKPNWKKLNSNQVFPEPGFKEYDFSDARYVYKLTTDLSEDDLISLFPEKKRSIERAASGKLDLEFLNGEERHNQGKDYPKQGDAQSGEPEEKSFDLLERYYKKWVTNYFIGDRKTGEIKPSESKEKADEFLQAYLTSIQTEQAQFQKQAMTYQMATMAGQVDPTTTPPPVQPPQQDPNRFFAFARQVPEIWYFAHTPGISSPLADEVAWFYPNWKAWPIIPVYSYFSTAPITGDDAHYLVQGVVNPVKGVQRQHNSAETLKLLHLNGAANSGWLAEEDSWVDPSKVEAFGSMPNVNLEYRKGRQKPEKIFPTPLSQAHTQIAQESAEAIKLIPGINTDLLALQEGGSDSGRAIALRQRQGLSMVQKPFDNLRRSKQLCGRLLLSQLGECYDTETAKKVLGEAFLIKNFPPPMLLDETGAVDPATGQIKQVPMPSKKTGQPMKYDEEMAELAIAEVLSGDLGQYDVVVGETVASETMRLANSAELQELAQTMPGLIPPQLLIEESQLPQSTKNKVLKAVEQAQAMAQAAQNAQKAGPAKKGEQNAERQAA